MFLVPKNACGAALPPDPRPAAHAAHRTRHDRSAVQTRGPGSRPGCEKVCAVARPKKRHEDARTERLNLRLLPDERAEIEVRAAAVGLTPTDYVRRAVLSGRLASIVTRKADPSLVLAINRAGVNLNQIARTLNSGVDHIPGDLAETLERINRLLDRLQDE